MISTGKSRYAGLVKKLVACWTMKIIQRAPEQMKNPMVRPLFQAFTLPPKEMAMKPVILAPENSTIPPKSSLADFHKELLVGTRVVRREDEMIGGSSDSTNADIDVEAPMPCRPRSSGRTSNDRT